MNTKIVCALSECEIEFDKVGKQIYCSKNHMKISAGRKQAKRRKEASKIKRGLADRFCDRSKCGKKFSPLRLNQRFCCTLCGDLTNEFSRQSRFSAKEFEDAYGDIE